MTNGWDNVKVSLLDLENYREWWFWYSFSNQMKLMVKISLRSMAESNLGHWFNINFMDNDVILVVDWMIRIYFDGWPRCSQSDVLDSWKLIRHYDSNGSSLIWENRMVEVNLDESLRSCCDGVIGLGKVKWSGTSPRELVRSHRFNGYEK